MRLRSLKIAGLLCCAALLPLQRPANAEDNACGPTTVCDEQLQTLRQDYNTLALKVRELQETNSLPLNTLRTKKRQKLRETVSLVKTQRQTMSDFQGFVTWMSGNLAGYNRYIQAGSYVAMVGRILPIPYAGQASVFAKFIAHFTLALNASSVAISHYLTSSQQFIAMGDRLDADHQANDKLIQEAARFADQRLLKDVNDAQAKLTAVSDLSSGALSFLTSLNQYVSGTDEYWNKAKGFFKKDIDPKEKSYLSESTSNLKSQADRFNSKLKTFDELSQKETASIKSLAVYDELEREVTRGGLLK